MLFTPLHEMHLYLVHEPLGRCVVRAAVLQVMHCVMPSHACMHACMGLHASSVLSHGGVKSYFSNTARWVIDNDGMHVLLDNQATRSECPAHAQAFVEQRVVGRDVRHTCAWHMLLGFRERRTQL